jgi:hypothetical protein
MKGMTGTSNNQDAYRNAQWAVNAETLGAFRDVHGRWPGKTAADPQERYLGRWLDSQRLQSRGIRRAHQMTKERRTHLSRVAPGWDTAPDLNPPHG